MPNTILVAGTGRSGTTWVGEVIAHATGARMVFEPFLLTEGHHFAGPWSWRVRRNFLLYLPPEAGMDSPWYEPVRRILDGSSSHDARLSLIKEIRANLMLGYLARTWPALKIVLVLRNPYEVIESQLAQRRRIAWDFDWSVDAAFSQSELMCDLLEPYRTLLEGAASIEERLACRWCIETLAPLRQAASMPNVLLRWYHELAHDTAAWELIREHLEPHPWSTAAFSARLPVRSASSRSRRRQGRPELTMSQARRIHAVLRSFPLEPLLDGRALEFRRGEQLLS